MSGFLVMSERVFKCCGHVDGLEYMMGGSGCVSAYCAEQLGAVLCSFREFPGCQTIVSPAKHIRMGAG